MRLVFIHGGVHTGSCWDDTVSEITRLRPEVHTLAVDLPGRRRVDGDLSTLSIEQCVAAVVRQIDDSSHISTRDDPLMLIGHSLAGVVLPGVVERLGRERVSRVVFVACCVPPVGRSVVDTLPTVMRPVVHRIAARSPVIDRMPAALMRYAFGNHATATQRARIRDHVVPESSALITEPVRARFPESVPRSWVLTTRDRALPVGRQRGFIRNVGGVDEVIPLDAAHEVMLTHPAELAATLVDVADRTVRA